MDVVSKLRELHHLGEAAATVHITALDKHIDANDVGGMQKFESGILEEICGDPLYFISPQEKQDLERLQEDRHKCAHPAYRRSGIIYQPSFELARAHMINAVDHLLAQPPMQGRTIVAEILAEMALPSFPTKPDRLKEFLSERVTRSSKATSIRSLVAVLLKEVLNGPGPELTGKGRVIVAVLATLAELDNAAWVSAGKDTLGRASAAFPDDGFRRLVSLLRVRPEAYEWLNSSIKQRFLTWIEKQDASTLINANAFSLISLPELGDTLLSTVKNGTESFQREVLESYVDPEFVTLAIKRVGNAGSFDSANRMVATILQPYKELFELDDVRLLLELAAENFQLTHSRGMISFLTDLFGAEGGFTGELKEEWLAYATSLGSGKLKPMIEDFYGVTEHQEQLEEDAQPDSSDDSADSTQN